jgi:hypothetical protein
MKSEPELPPPSDPLVPDRPEPLKPAAGHGIVTERLVSMNGLISLLMLLWGAAVLRNPALLRAVLSGLCRRFPWLVGRRRPA